MLLRTLEVTSCFLVTVKFITCSLPKVNLTQPRELSWGPGVQGSSSFIVVPEKSLGMRMQFIHQTFLCQTYCYKAGLENISLSLAEGKCGSPDSGNSVGWSITLFLWCHFFTDAVVFTGPEIDLSSCWRAGTAYRNYSLFKRIFVHRKSSILKDFEYCDLPWQWKRKSRKRENLPAHWAPSECFLLARCQSLLSLAIGLADFSSPLRVDL